MALPTYRPHEPTTHTTPPTPTTRTVPDEGHPNAADKPWYERPAHAGATGLDTQASSEAQARKVKDVKDDKDDETSRSDRR